MGRIRVVVACVFGLILPGCTTDHVGGTAFLSETALLQCDGGWRGTVFSDYAASSGDARPQSESSVIANHASRRTMAPGGFRVASRQVRDSIYVKRSSDGRVIEALALARESGGWRVERFSFCSRR